MGFLNFYGKNGSSSGSGGGGGNGAPGAPGPVGVIFGDTAPTSEQGIDGQGYIHKTTGDLYVKSAGAWSFTLNLKGNPGAGVAGPIGMILDNGAPSIGVGTSQQGYIDMQTFNFYKKAGGVWGLIGNLKGPQGIPGIGTPGAPGSGIANAVAWQANTAYPITNNQRPAVIYQNELYISDNDVPSRATFTPGDWEVKIPKGQDGTATLPDTVVKTDTPATFGAVEIGGGLIPFVSRSIAETTNGVYVLQDSDTGKELGFSANSLGPFVIRVPGTLKKGHQTRIRREGSVKVQIVPDTTSAVGHCSTIAQISAAAPAFVANQYDACMIQVRYKSSLTTCDFFVDGPVATS